MRIGELFHVVHVVDDLPEAEVWYDKVFSPTYMFRRHESDLDHRIASLMLIADLPAEPLSPFPTPAGRSGTIGKFAHRFGQRLHSLAFYTDSVAEGYERFRSHGVRVSGDGGVPLTSAPTRGGIYTHPRDSFGLLELMEPRIGGSGGAPIGDSLGECYDPRLKGDHDPTWWIREHPLGIRRTGRITVLVDDIDRATELYCKCLDAEVFHEAGNPRRVFVLVGPSTVIELAAPRPDSEESAGLDHDGPMIWSVTFEVSDLAAAAGHLRSSGCRFRETDGQLLVATGDAKGARYAFTEVPVPGDPRMASEAAGRPLRSS